MNTTELKALQWIKKKYNYKDKDIVFNLNASPDFVCKDGKRFEVKLLCGKTLLFSTEQLESLKDTDTILVFSYNGQNSFPQKTHIPDEPYLIFKWKDKDNIFKTYGKGTLRLVLRHRTLGFSEDIWKRLHLLSIEKTLPLDETIEFLLDFYQSKEGK